MSKSNYILGENETLSDYQFSGQKVFNILKYITANQQKLNNAINMHSALTSEKQTFILSKTEWNETEKKDGFLKEVSISIPCLIDTKDKYNVNIVVSPTEEYGQDIDEDGEEIFSEETSRELYSDYNIRCIDYNFENKETEEDSSSSDEIMTATAEEEEEKESTNITLTFKSDDIPEFNLPINILILYNRKITNEDLNFDVIIETEEEEEEV